MNSLHRDTNELRQSQVRIRHATSSRACPAAAQKVVDDYLNRAVAASLKGQEELSEHFFSLALAHSA